MGLYDPIKNFISGGSKESSLFTKIATAFTTGLIGMCAASPTDLVKVRLQAQGRWKILDPSKIKYKGVLNAYSTIFKQEGLLAFWTGLVPNCARNSIINAVELATFD